MQTDLLAQVEGLLFVSGEEGLSVKEMVTLLNCPEVEIDAALTVLSGRMAQDDRGIRLARLGDRYRLTTKAQHAHLYKDLAASPIRSQLSRAALEVLAMVAYHEPITRVEIDEVRGVNSERVITSLVTKQLIETCGRAEGPGRALLYRTTPAFLDHFGLETRADLPPLESFALFEEEEDDSLFHEGELLEEERSS
ncbi:SMC-Scp complex subunit ScpB [Bacillus sp. FSL W7-1360]